tara:strand:+ start:110 stop:487 length:378 start_codon:yes stop_codon:yes gene_type:complete
MKITKTHLARIIKEELSAVTAEGYGNYKRDDEYDYSADEHAYDAEFSLEIKNGVEKNLDDWNGTPAPKHEIVPGVPEGVDEMDWKNAAEDYLKELVADRTVVVKKGAPGDDWNGDEPVLYVLAPR